MIRLVVAGLGYTGSAVARDAVAAGMRVAATARDPSGVVAPRGVEVVAFADAGPAIRSATHLLATAAPDDAAGDPVLAAHRAAIGAAPDLRWIGYLSTTGVYGDRGGAWVDEATPPAPGSARGHRRVAAEQALASFADRRAVDLFRLAGIYGPGRSAIDDVRAGRARRIIKPGHAFGRIHRDDIAHAVMAALGQTLPPGVRVLNLADDLPAASADVIEEAARVLGASIPPAIPFEQALPAMSPIGASFWAENRRIANAATKVALGIAWLYPTYREGLRAILAAERGEGPAQQGEVGRA